MRRFKGRDAARRYEDGKRHHTLGDFLTVKDMEGIHNTWLSSDATPRVSVILSTYNQPLWLEKVLWGYGAQRFHDFEVVVADDGSGEARGEPRRVPRIQRWRLHPAGRFPTGALGVALTP